MKNLLEQFFKKASTDEVMVVEHRNQPEKEKNEGLSSKQFTWGALAISALLLCFCTYMTLDMFTVDTGAIMNSFNAAKDEAAEEVYQFFYDKSYDAAEKAHHVSNRVSISMGDLKEQQKLEVLKVSDVEYETTDSEDKGWIKALFQDAFNAETETMVCWMEVPGYGIFTVNLQAGEFILDEERQYALIRIPSPKMTEFAIDFEKVEVLLFDDGKFRDSAKCGEDIAIEQLKGAEIKMKRDINNNQEFYKRARKTTETMLVNLVKQLNPKLPDLIVEIEFID